MPFVDEITVNKMTLNELTVNGTISDKLIIFGMKVE
jgi:hypothetical protein